MQIITALLSALLSFPLFASEAQRELLSNPNDPKHKVEIFWSKPPGNGPFPAMIIVHGHQGTGTRGAEVIASSGMFHKMLKKGLVPIAVSQSGYGGTSGSKDNCGLNSQGALKAAIAFAQKQKFIHEKKIVAFGHSMGASLITIVAGQNSGLAAGIVSNGIYDLADALKRLDVVSFKDQNKKMLHDQLDKETGSKADRFFIRSALFHADKIKIPLLILAGGGDSIAPPEQAIRLHDKIKESGGKSHLVIFPFSGHALPLPLVVPEIQKFLNEQW